MLQLEKYVTSLVSTEGCRALGPSVVGDSFNYRRIISLSAVCGSVYACRPDVLPATNVNDAFSVNTCLSAPLHSEGTH